MQLVAYGAQDVYLTGNPQITFFKVVYRRHTNFSLEMDELPIDNDFEFPVRSVLLGPRTQLYTAQDYLAIHKVRHYLKKSGNFPLPEITVVKGKRWIWNGHHRIIASRLAGTPLYVYSYKVD